MDLFKDLNLGLGGLGLGGCNLGAGGVQLGPGGVHLGSRGGGHPPSRSAPADIHRQIMVTHNFYINID